LSDLATLSAERDDGLVIAVIGGEVDPSNSRMIGREITALVPNDAFGVVLDLSGVEFLDSSGVQMLFELAERLEARQQRLAVVVPAGSPARPVLDIVSIDAIAPLVGTREEAVERLNEDR
jgi:anti-anti-sigma factor